MKIPVSHGHLEAALREAEGEVAGGAVFCHPDPLQGGTMSTKAVYRAGQALNEAGLRVLRFNFRGVGCSTGTYDGGIGEQEDVRAASLRESAVAAFYTPKAPATTNGCPGDLQPNRRVWSETSFPGTVSWSKCARKCWAPARLGSATTSRPPGATRRGNSATAASALARV